MTGRIVFENPNSPEQPAAGTYRWFFIRGSEEVTIYVGRAGGRARSVGAPSTLKRGIQEAQRSCVSSDKGKYLDTDFIVGTALLLLRDSGVECRWQHMSEDPFAEAAEAAHYQSVLQAGTATIRKALRLKKPGRDARWQSSDIDAATDALRGPLAEIFPELTR
jgi:hypothetical protein